MLRRILFPILLILCVILIARVGDRFEVRIDLSRQQGNSLSPSAAQALERLQAPLRFTAYLPELAVQRAAVRRLLAPYLAHPSAPSLHFIDPVRSPDQARAAGIKSHGELHLNSGTRQEVIQQPDSATIDRALNRLALSGERWIVSLRGQGERELDTSPQGLSRLAGHVERLGYRLISIDPRQVDEIPDNTAVLLIAGPQQRYGPATTTQIERFLQRGGGVLWLLDLEPPTLLTERFGIDLLPGRVVDAAAAQFGLDQPDRAIVSDYPEQLWPYPPSAHSVLPRSVALRVSESADWQQVAALQSGPRSWNETGALQGQISRDPLAGEQAGPLTLGVALQNKDDPQRRLLVIGSPDFISNDQLGQAGNLELAIGLLNWLSDNQQLTPPAAATDLEVGWSAQTGAILAVGLMGVAPLTFFLFGVWLRLARRRA